MRGRNTALRGIARSRVVVLVFMVTALGGLSWPKVHRRDHPTGLVIITLDTTRADRLSPYGFMDAVMPHLDRLAREGVVFDQATSVAPLTLPAHCSLLTGLFPSAHGVRDNADPALASEHTTLAEILSARGFRTAAVVGSIVLDAQRGLAQGFEWYAGVGNGPPDRAGSWPLERRANEVMDDAMSWLEGVDESPFFLWVHLYDPHRPYDPPEPYRSRVGDPYIGEIAFDDSQIGRLLDALEQRRQLNRTVVVVAGDHGESMGDHGERDHGVLLYESVLHVPLIFMAPNLSPGRIAEVVRLVDVMPTVLNLLGVAPSRTDGVSLVDLMRGGAQHLDLEAYAESLYPQRLGWSPLRSLRAGRFKFIDAPRPELYDLERDPFEQHNIYDQRRNVAALMKQRLVALAHDAPGRATRQAEIALSADVRQRLASLGYIGPGAVRSSLDRDDLPDSKDCIGVYFSPASAPGRGEDTRCGGASPRSVSPDAGGTAPSR